MSSNIVFSEIENENVPDKMDPRALDKTLKGLNFQSPATFGGAYKDISRKGDLIQEFNVHTPPDIPFNTRILAVCGIHQNDASPQKDGWFLSDFFAFWHIFNGTTRNQQWIHCLDLESLVQKHTRYLHGNPYKKRKVVLDKEILTAALKSPHAPVSIKAMGIKVAVIKRIRETCVAAEAAGENVLILVFGHGSTNGHGIFCGGKSSINEKMDISRLLRVKDLKSIISKNPQVKVSLIATHCFSGGWTCLPDLNIISTTAAGPNNESRSWRASGSSGRFCGSMFTTAVIEKMTKYGGNNSLSTLAAGDEGEEEYTEQQMESMSEFSRSVYETLLRDVDRRGMEHEFSFNAQDDAWSMCWRERTGIPLAALHERWNQLEDWESDQTFHPGDPQNRDPHVSQKTEEEYARRLDEARKGKGKENKASLPNAPAGEAPGGKRKISALYGGEKEALVSVVSNVGSQYLASYGPDGDSGNDGGLQNAVYRIQKGQERDTETMEWVLRVIEYRTNSMAMADQYLEKMNISAPRNQRCCEYDATGLEKKINQAKYRVLYKMLFDDYVLFPDPMEDQGQPFYKSRRYLIAAFDASGLPKTAIARKFNELVSSVDAEMDDHKEIVKRDPEVVAKRRKLFHAFDVLRDLSPAKRHSRG